MRTLARVYRAADARRDGSPQSEQAAYEEKNRCIQQARHEGILPLFWDVLREMRPVVD